jgi:hypothetical protein
MPTVRTVQVVQVVLKNFVQPGQGAKCTSCSLMDSVSSRLWIHKHFLEWCQTAHHSKEPQHR